MSRSCSSAPSEGLGFLDLHDDKSAKSLAYTYVSPASDHGDDVGIVFLHGLLSDMTGTKSLTLLEQAKRTGHSFLSLDMTGHGRSSGSLLASGPADWLDDILAVLDQKATAKRLIVVGSSCGGWLALHVALQRPQRVAGLVLVAPAVDFTSRWWSSLSFDQQVAAVKSGQLILGSSYVEPGKDRVGMELFTQGLQLELVIGKDKEQQLAIECPVRIIHGMEDDVVPISWGHELVERLRTRDVVMACIKDGDHRLSRPQDLQLLRETVLQMISTVDVV